MAMLANCACVRRSEEHTSELQSHLNLVCRLLLEKKHPRQSDTSPPEGTPWGGATATTPLAAVSPVGSDPALPPPAPRSTFTLASVLFFLKTRPPPEFSPFPHPAPFPT